MSKSIRAARRCLFFVLSACCLAGLWGCAAAQADPLVGLWKADRVESGGQVIPFSQYEEQFHYAAFSFEFAEDGRLVAESGGVPAQGTYTFDGDIVTIDLGSGTWTLAYEDGELVWEQLGVKIILAKA